MMNELAPYKRLFLEEEPIRPDEDARADAIAAAMARFEKISPNVQETGRSMRLRNRIVNFWNRRTPMRTLKLNHALMAGASLAALMTLVVSGPALYRLMTDVAVQPEPGSVQFQTAAGGDDAISQTRLPKDQARVGDLGLMDPAQKVLDNEVALQPAIAAAEQQVVYDAIPEGAAAEVRAGLVQQQPSLEQAEPPTAPSYREENRDRFSKLDPNPVKQAAEEPLSTFSIDTDTSSYSFLRRSLMENLLPSKDAIRVEEMINYFPYDYEGPADRSQPFKANVTLMQTPWNPDTRLMHIGIKGFSLDGAERPRANLVFLIDTSGSMDEPGKLPLLINSFRMLLDTLSPDDSVAIVTYAGNAGTVLAPTKASDKARILAALDALSAGGSTAGAEGIEQAYALAEQNLDTKGVNRVILATDGDFNVGISSPRELESFVERKRDSGIYLSVLGFGQGNYNDELMQALAQTGNGNAAYIDTLNEARKVLVEEATSTLFPIANDVKIQVEFNPAAVSEYRLIGYETRLLNREDFNNDKVDAGDIGAGHTVTAIYEVTPKGSKGQLVDTLRYGTADSSPGASDEYAFVKIRYKLPEEAESRLITEPVTAANAKASTEASFAIAVAAFGQILRGGEYTKSFSYDEVIALANANRGSDEFGYRAELVNLVRLAKSARAMQ
jgi:Ca-activated chloride channel homolog